MMNKKKITLIGPYSEIGGVSIHIKRLNELLKGHFNFHIVNESKKYTNEPTVINLRRLEIIKYLYAIKNSDIVHIHSGSKLLIFFHLVSTSFFSCKSIVTLHSYRKSSVLLNLFVKTLSSKVVAVNENIKNRINIENSIVLNAFIPPISEQNAEISSEIVKIISEKKKKGMLIITGNAFRIVDYNNKDLYGIDQLIELATLIKKEKLNMFILFFVASLYNCESKYFEYVQIIKNLALEDYITLLNKQVPFVKIILKSDLVIRPTIIDGDALTIRESIYFRKPVIASDSIKRPMGTILYETSNVKDLFAKVKHFNSNRTIPDEAVYELKYYEDIYLDLYNLQ